MTSQASELIRWSTIDETLPIDRPTDRPNRASAAATSQCELPYFICYMHRDIVYIIPDSFHCFLFHLALFLGSCSHVHVCVYCEYCVLCCYSFIHLICMRHLVSGFFLEIQLKLYQDKFNAVWIGFYSAARCWLYTIA